MKIISNRFKLVMMTGVLLLVVASCVKLKEIPQDFAGPDNFYNTPQQIESAAIAAMATIFGSWDAYSYWMFYDLNNDDQYPDGNLVLSDDYGTDIWPYHYRAIAYLNPAIKALNDNKLGNSATQEEKDELMAQLKFIRAWNYFVLVRLWGDVPLILETTDAVAGQIQRAPIRDVYAQIESDLLIAVDKLPDTWPAEKVGRMAKAAAKTLLAKVYITMATAPLNDATYYVKARDMALDAMNDDTYSLVHDIDKVFVMSNSYGPEMMWSFNASEDDENCPPQIWLPGSMSNGWGDIHTDLTWALGFPEQPRKYAYLFWEDYDGNPYTTFSWSPPSPGIKKFLSDTPENREKYLSTQNYPIIRYAETLLLFAEAENMVNGPTQAACDAINQVIDRANGYVDNPAYPLLTTAMTKAAFDAAVIEERNWELCYEYDRWYDLCRKRILEERTIPAYRQNFSPEDYLYPIPQRDLRLNPLMTQNPGYTTPPR